MTALMTRREALAALTGGATAILTGAEATAQVAEPEGCLIKAEHLAALGWNRASFARHRPGDPLRTGTGDRALDRALGHALTKISKMFGQNPAFGFFDDSSRPNAYAYSGTIVQGTRGTVGFGRTLFRRLLGGFNDGGVSVMAVIAHEFGHIAQFGARSHLPGTEIGPQNREVRGVARRFARGILRGQEEARSAKPAGYCGAGADVFDWRSGLQQSEPSRNARGTCASY